MQNITKLAQALLLVFAVVPILNAHAIDFAEQIQSGDVPVPTNTVEYRSLKELPQGFVDSLAANARNEKGMGGKDLRLVPAGEAQILDLVFQRAQPPEKILGNLKFQLSIVPEDRFANYYLIGIIPEGSELAGPWTRVSRAYVGIDDTKLLLTEWAYKADGGGVMSISEFHNSDINGIPASVSCQTAREGMSVWKVVWTTKEKFYTVYLQKKAFAYADRDSLLEIARSIRD